MSDEMEEIISEFITEAEESLDKIEPLFVELEQKGEDKEMLNEIFRSMHTIKGAAGFLGFQSVVDVAHASENIMKKLRDGEIPLSTRLMDVILKSIDMLRLLLDHLKSKDGVEEDVSPLVNELGNALEEASSGQAPQGTDGKKEKDTSPGTAFGDNSIPQAETEPAKTPCNEEQPDESPEHDAAQQTDERPVSQVSSGEAEQLSATKTSEGLRAGNENHDQHAKSEQKTIDHGQKLKEKSSQNLRVDVERIDKVMDLTGEVVLVRNRLLNIASYLNKKYENDPHLETLIESVSFLDRITSDMQLAVMRIRMQPIKKVLTKFPRLVRDMSASVNKEVELIISGEGTEVDKTVIENIGDPLTHILRNSIDHGIESTEERLKKGKPAKGKIEIEIFQKGNQIVIEIFDDGQGIDLSKLKQKAIEKGLITQEDASQMSDEAATDIIFMPGFSTKEVATELSGRGVGMDVVKTNISQLNGFVEIHTKKDVGTTFRICIPLTLAIIQALMVEVSGIKYAIPLSPVEETLMVSPDEIDNVSGQRVIVIRDRVCPIIELKDVLNSGSNGRNGNEYKFLVVISLGDRRFCVVVDRLVGQEEVVIKNLNGLDTSSSYVLGATITGDGKVVFILDFAAIARNLVGATK